MRRSASCSLGRWCTPLRTVNLAVNAVDLGTRAVIAAAVDDERVVELALVLAFLDHSADLVVGVGEVGGMDIGLSG